MFSIVIASRNPVKIRASLAGFREMFSGATFEARGVAVASGVADQPMSDAETLRGAENRAQGAVSLASDADFWVGLEGGVEDGPLGMAAFAWAVVRASGGAVGRGKGGLFFLPPPVADLIRAGRDLGEADDIVFGGSNAKQAHGAVGILTGDAIDRSTYYAAAVTLALIPLKNPALYAVSESHSPAVPVR